jgi:parallel beta-helix repeat protein
MKKLAFLAVLMCASIPGAATYYVDFSNGQNSNSGRSQALAWKQSPGDASATLVPAQTALFAGDTVLFKGGVAYKGQICVKWSGTGSAAPVTFDGNSAGTWGTGKAIIDGENARSNGFTSSGNISYVTIRNFEIRSIKYTGIAWAGGCGIQINNASHVTIADCCIHDVGYWNNDGSTVPAGSGINMIEPVNCLITGNEITKTGLGGIQLNGPQNNVISNNDIHDYITWGVDLGGDYQLCTGNNVCGNTIHDLWQHDAGFWGGTGDPPHTDYIFIRMGNGQRPVKNTVERNLFYNNYNFTDFGGTAMVFLSYADSTVIRNNVFINPHEYYAAFFGWTSDGTKFYNNTIYGPRTGGIRFETGGHNDVRNNIIVATGQFGYANSGDLANMICDYNLYFCVKDAQSFVQISPYSAHTFAAWKAMGYDAHGTKAASIADIGFVSTDGYPAACQTMNLNPCAASPAVNAGATIPGFTCDKNLTERPEGVSWDIGAYEFTGVTAVTPGGIAPVQSAGRILPRECSIGEFVALLGRAGYTAYSATGKRVEAQNVRRNAVYFLRSADERTARKVVVLDR